MSKTFLVNQPGHALHGQRVAKCDGKRAKFPNKRAPFRATDLNPTAIIQSHQSSTAKAINSLMRAYDKSKHPGLKDQADKLRA